ncbi:MAG: tRNA (adenosine(37)-N6)-dimethylallyltransferase MiaA [Pseudomonadota bacterium]
MIKKDQITIICGPTASGKSALAMNMARRIGGAVINADSCQVYKELPTLTASPTTEDKSEIPHYLYNFLSISDDFSVAKYLDIAKKTVEEVRSIGLHPIIVGGTGLYINALLYGLSNIPEITPDIRQRSREEFENLGRENFYNRLISLDPLLEGKIKQGDSQRMIRAFEVLMQSGKSIVDYQKHKTGNIQGDVSVIFLLPERKFLYKTCDERFIHMVESGGLEEVKSNLIQGRSSPKILGLKELTLYLQGELLLSEAISLAQAKTRQYAKRQITWFTHQIQEKKIMQFGTIGEFEKLLCP